LTFWPGYLLVDVDESGRPIGIEVLCSPAEVDEALTTLARRFLHLDVNGLRTAVARKRQRPAHGTE
jgi:hypothetical protein